VAQLNGDLSGFSGILDIPPPGAGGKVAFSNISQSAALSPGAVVSVQSGATLYLGTTDTSVNVPAALELLGAGNSENLGALRIERGAVWSGPVTMKANSFIGSQNGSGGKILGSIRDIGGSFGFTKQGIQTLTLAGANTFSGTTVHNGAGSLTLANSLALQNSTLAYTGGGLMFDQGVASHSFTLGGLTGTAGITLRDNAASPAPVQLSAGRNNANTSFSGSLGGPGSFDKSGNGMLTLFGRNTYAGPTTVSGGTLRLAVPTGLPANLKIMPLGDSITYGFNGTNAGYRGLLYSALSPVAPNFQYVGSSVVNPGSLPASPVDQRHNEGHSSYTINDVSNNLDGFDNARFLQYGGPERNPNGGHWFDGIPNIRDPIYPDVITMMIGTNDVTNLTGIDTRLQDLIAKITTMRPSAKLLVAKISPLPDFQAAMETYNGIVENQVAGFQAAGKQVYLVDMRTGFPANGLDPDRVHPNDIGFTFMTSRWYDGIFAAFASGPAALPDNSPVTVAAGAMLDLNGTRAVVGSLSGAGFVSLGNGGGLVANITGGCAFGGTVLGSGTVTKTGTGVLALSGLFAHSGDTRITQGCLSVSGSVSCSGVIEVQSGAELELDGGTLTAAAIHICTGGRLHGDGLINAEVVNEGEITGADGQALVFTGRLRNHGLIRMTGGAVLQADGEFINSGTLDLITGAPVMAQNMSNSGQLLDGSAVGVNSFLITPEAVTVTVRSYTGHTYQLQHSADLSPESWQNAAAPQQGATGTTLSFQTTEGVAGMHGFYRIAASP
jgi:autotransporter-associated beta strand protein